MTVSIHSCHEAEEACLSGIMEEAEEETVDLEKLGVSCRATALRGHQGFMNFVIWAELEVVDRLGAIKRGSTHAHALTYHAEG